MKSPHNNWTTFNNGSTIGKTGCEGGRIIRDEEHAFGARITLEKRTATIYSITLASMV